MAPERRPVSKFLMAAMPHISVSQKDNNPIIKENKALSKNPKLTLQVGITAGLLGFQFLPKLRS